jgi:hypothetical protein
MRQNLLDNRLTFNAAVRRLDNDFDLPLTALAGRDGAATGSIRMRPN